MINLPLEREMSRLMILLYGATAYVTAYVLIALQLEERDLLSYHGETYSAYQRQVRMLVPIPAAETRKPAE